MKLHYIFILLFSCILLGSNAQAQNKYPQNYFRPPIDGPIYLSGTFGELRSNHFHAGDDIKTGGKEGANVYATANGWVSRVKISPWGYGNALYIEHPNGYTTVCGHLKELKGPIAKYVRDQQYKRKQFAVDLYLKQEQFPVKKGEIVALSGNTGGSGGPHVHYEIRETATQEPINPLLFGIPVKDFMTPLIRSVRIYPAEKGGLIDGQNKAKTLQLKGWEKNYTPANKDSIKIQGDFYLGINTIDKQNDSNNKNGVYQIEVFVDSNLFYSHSVERLNFANTRYINSLIDYQYYKDQKSRYQRTYISPNNKLDIYKKAQNRGIISFKDKQYHLIEYIVKDAADNTSILRFSVLSIPLDSIYPAEQSTAMNPLIENSFQNDNIEVHFPARCLYDTMSFSTDIFDAKQGSISSIYRIGRENVGLQKNINVTLKNIVIADSIKSKVFIGRLNKKDISAINAHWQTNNVSFKTKNFGNFGVFIDTTAPSIKLLTKKDSILHSKQIVFRVKDVDSGIKQYKALLNGKWVLLAWDPKTSRMFHRFESKPKKNDKIEIIISDKVGNTSSKTFVF